MINERQVMTHEEVRQKEEVLTVGPAASSRSVSPTELRDLYRKVNGTLLQLRGLMFLVTNQDDMVRLVKIDAALVNLKQELTQMTRHSMK